MERIVFGNNPDYAHMLASFRKKWTKQRIHYSRIDENVNEKSLKPFTELRKDGIIKQDVPVQIRKKEITI